MLKRRSNYAQQPAVAAVLKIPSRPKGATIVQIAKARGLEPHTVRVRAVIRRPGTRGKVRITRTKAPKGGLVYRAVRP
jgi:hypothetical protein